MQESIILLILWVVALFVGYKFVVFNITHVEKFPNRYFDNNAV